MTTITLPLAIGQTVVWAALFYIFPALLPTWELETGWSKAELTGAFTLALLTAAAASPAAGRLIDRGYGRHLILGGTVCVALGLIVLSQVTSLWQFYLVWLVLGGCMAACLYEPCFALLVRHLQVEAKPAITRITLIAGLAGTVAFPTVHWLTGFLDWRQAVLCFSGGVLLITLPLSAISVIQLQSRFHVERPPRKSRGAPVPYGRKFWLLAGAFMLIAIVHGMIITHLLPLLAERNVTVSVAILAASSIGPMQVVGRLLMLASESRASNLTIAMTCYGGMACGITALLFAGADTLLILAFVVLHGAAYGVTSIIRPVLTREILGSTSFGQISGRIGGLFMLGTAIAPFGGALIWQWTGYTAMLGLSVMLMLLGIFLVKLAANAAPTGTNAGEK